MDTNPVLMNKLSMDSDIPLYSQLVSIIKRNISAGTLDPARSCPARRSSAAPSTSPVPPCARP